MRLNVQAVHSAILECPVALGAIAKKLECTRRHLRSILGESQQDFQLSLFELIPDAIIHMLGYLDIKDAALLDIAVSESGMRQTFLSFLGSNKLSYGYSKIDGSEIPWIARRGLRLKEFDFSSINADAKLLLSSLKPCNFDRLKVLDMVEYTSYEGVSIITKVATACRTLERLIFDNSLWGNDVLYSIVPRNPNICELIIVTSSTERSFSLQDVLQHTSRLQSLELHGRCLPKSIVKLTPIPTLTNVFIDNVCAPVIGEDDELSAFCDDHLRKIADIAPNLNHLCLLHCLSLTIDGYTYAAQKCPKVSYLHLGEFIGTAAATSTADALRPFLTPTLTELVLTSYKYGASEMSELVQLLKLSGHWLQKVNIYCKSKKHRELIDAVLEGCTTLKELTLNGDCCRISRLSASTELHPYDLSQRRGLLDLDTTNVLSFAQLAVISVCFPKLLRLTIFCLDTVTTAQIMTLLTSCQLLRNLSISSDTHMVASITDLFPLINMPPTALEKLTLQFDCLDCQFMACLLTRCPMLRWITLHYNITGYAVLDVSIAGALTLSCPLLTNVTISNVPGAVPAESARDKVVSMLPHRRWYHEYQFEGRDENGTLLWWHLQLRTDPLLGKKNVDGDSEP